MDYAMGQLLPSFDNTKSLCEMRNPHLKFVEVEKVLVLKTG